MHPIFLLIASYLLRGTESSPIGLHAREKSIKQPSEQDIVPSLNNSKRELEIGLQLKLPTTERSQELKALEKELIQTLAKEIENKAIDKISDTAELKSENKDHPEPLLLKPAFECDQWDPPTRTCWLDRNIGDTVTFSLSTSVRVRHHRPDVVWRREFAQRDSRARKEYVIDTRKSSPNLVIGRRGYELRVSPVTEIDVDDNLFSATFAENANTKYAKVNFRIRIMAEDLGFVYIGETLDLSIESYVTLPLDSMTYHWYTEKDGEVATLPSNMRVSSTGETLRISELRQEQEGVIACSVYTNRDVHATKKRFLIKELAKNKNVLKTFSNPDLTFEEEKLKRDKKKVELQEKPNDRHLKSSHPERQKENHSENSPDAKRDVNEANMDSLDEDILKANSNPSLTFQEEKLKHSKKKVGLQEKPINKHPKSSHPNRKKENRPKKSPNRKREVNKANMDFQDKDVIKVPSLTFQEEKLKLNKKNIEVQEKTVNRPKRRAKKILEKSPNVKEVNEANIDSLDKDDLKYFSDPSLTFHKGKLKHNKKKVGLQEKPVNRHLKSSHPKKQKENHPKKTSSAKREVNEANVEDEHYASVQSSQDTPYTANVGQQADKTSSAKREVDEANVEDERYASVQSSQDTPYTANVGQQADKTSSAKREVDEANVEDERYDSVQSSQNTPYTANVGQQANKTSSAKREVNEADVEDEHYSLVQSSQNTPYTANVGQQADKTSSAKREVNEANVGGEHYALVQSSQDTPYSTNEDQQADKSLTADDGMNFIIKDFGEDQSDRMNLSIGNSSDSETVIDFKLRQENKTIEDDKIAQLVSYCIRDLQCSKHASCVRSSLREKGFCRCLPGFYGPGIFCREEM